MLDDLERRFRQIAPKAEFCSMRYQRYVDEGVSVRQSVPSPVSRSDNAGVMITVIDGGGYGYGATSDLSTEGLKRAAEQAAAWAKRAAGASVVDFSKVDMPHPTGEYHGPNVRPWDSVPLSEKFDALMAMNKQLKTSDKIVDWSASMWHRDVEMFYVTINGGRVHQTVHMTAPMVRATANDGGDSQTRTFGSFNYGQQGGMEVLDRYGMADAPPTVAAEALELLAAPNCPSESMDVLLAPDQMVLQIHESIGHPLRARPHPRRRAKLRGHELRHAGDDRQLPLRLGPAEHHLRPDAARAVGQLRLRRRGLPRPRSNTSSRTASSCGCSAERSRRPAPASTASPTPGPTPGTARPSIAWPT